MSRLLKNHQYNRTSFLEPNNREKNQEENRTLKFQKSIVLKIISTNTQLTKYTTKYLNQHNSRELYTLYIHTTTSDLLEISSLYKNLVHLLFHLKIPANPFFFREYRVCCLPQRTDPRQSLSTWIWTKGHVANDNIGYVVPMTT